MATPIQLPDVMERAVRFVEETAPEQVVEETVRRLREGAPAKELLAAAALAVSRSTELPTEHHGGPIHPVSGIHAISQSSAWLDGDWKLMPIVHSVALANKHIHSPYMGPAIMPALTSASDPMSTEELEHAFMVAVRDLQPVTAERHLVALLHTHSPAQILDLVLEIAIRRNGFDDHYFLYIVHATRALDSIGHEWAEVVLRPAVRYLANKMQTVGTGEEEDHPRYKEKLALYHRFEEIEALIEKYDLTPDGMRVETDESESEAVAELGERIGASDRYTPICEMLARALGEGLSLMGTAEALSYGAALLHLRTDYGNPFDVHLHTGMNARRYLLGLDAVSARNKVLSLITWPLGREIQITEDRIMWPARHEVGDDVKAMGETELLDAVTESITGRPAPDLESVKGHVELLRCGDAARETIALAQAYGERGYDADRFFQRMGELVCRDDFSEMHAFKHLQAAREEHAATREPLGWAHLASTAKMAWCTYGHAQDVYREATKHLTV